jgi:DNA-binding Lrp family transcriptional regulator
MTALDAVDRRLVVALQAGLPLAVDPWAKVAEDVGLEETEVLERVRRMRESGVIRRIAAVPNHYRLGMTANGMSVWDVEDGEADRLGTLIGALDFVSHCYRRPRALPEWPFNLFAMLHGSSREEVEGKRRVVAGMLGRRCRASDILYSTAILKKSGLRLAGQGD